MSKVDFEKVVALLQELETNKSESLGASWLSTGTTGVDTLELETALVAVEAAKRMGMIERLQEAKKAQDKRVRKAAGSALHVLKSTGHDVVDEKNEGGWSLGTEDVVVPPPIGFIGLPQGDGYFPFILIAHNRDGACVSAGVAGSGQGYQDADHAHTGRSQARDIVANAAKDPNLFEVPFHVALHFTERAFREGGNRKPHGWSHMLQSVPEGTQNAARMMDPMSKQETELDRKELENVVPLVDGAHKLPFKIEEQIANPAIDRCIAAVTSELARDDGDKRQRIASEVVEAANQSLQGPARATWLLALDVASYVAEISEWEDERKAARHTALALRAGLVGADIPFFRIWTERQLAAVTEMVLAVRAGHEVPTQ